MSLYVQQNKNNHKIIILLDQPEAAFFTTLASATISSPITFKNFMKFIHNFLSKKQLRKQLGMHFMKVRYTLCPSKKHPEHFQFQLSEELSDYNNFWYKYSRNNWPSNDHSFSHLTQCLFLHYLQKREPTKYYFFIQCGMIT